MLEFADRQKDPLIYGFVAGLLGTLWANVVHWAAVYLGVARSTTGHYLSQLMFPHQEVILSKLLLGEFIHLMAGGIFGVLILLLYFLTGYPFAVLKGLGVGVATWILHVAIIPNLVIPRIYVYRTFNEALVDLAAHLVWGGIAAWFLVVTKPRPGIDKMLLDAPSTARPRGRALHRKQMLLARQKKNKGRWRKI